MTLPTSNGCCRISPIEPLGIHTDSFISEEGIVQQLRSVGEGIVDWEEALVI